MDLPSLQLRRLLPQADRGYTIFDASSNGRRLAWVADDSLIKVLDLDEDRLVREIMVPDGFCCGQLLLTPDGTYLMTLGNFTARLWFLSSGREIYTRGNVQADGQAMGRGQW